jgi:hypothetical protein
MHGVLMLAAFVSDFILQSVVHTTVNYAERNDNKLLRLSCPISLLTSAALMSVRVLLIHSIAATLKGAWMQCSVLTEAHQEHPIVLPVILLPTSISASWKGNQTTWSIENPSFPSFKQWETPLVHLSVSWTILQPMSLVKRTMPWWVLQVQINSYLMRQTIWATQSTYWNVSKVEDIADQNLAAIGGFNDKERSEIDKIAKDSERRKWYNDWDQ